jgi:hypothetical protein
MMRHGEALSLSVLPKLSSHRFVGYFHDNCAKNHDITDSGSEPRHRCLRDQSRCHQCRSPPISCCTGAELQLRHVRLKPDTTEDREIVQREMYPMKTDLYERARDVRTEHERAAPR